MICKYCKENIMESELDNNMKYIQCPKCFRILDNKYYEGENNEK